MNWVDVAKEIPIQSVEGLPGFFLLLNVGRERDTKEGLLNMKEPGLDGLNSEAS